MSDRVLRDDKLPDEDPLLADRLRDVLAERGRTTNGDIRAILDDVAVLPDRGGGPRRSWFAAAAAVALLIVGGALVLGRVALPRVGSPPVGRDAFSGDSRLTRCEDQIGPASQVFEMTHAEWFPLYLPGWGWKGMPELEVADPALVVIGQEFLGGFLGPAPGPDDPSPAPTRPPARFLCVAVGPSGDARIHTYGPTTIDEVVPVLSDADVARAEHLDPEVLADPAAWEWPERLAPCGGVTGNERYVFEANPLSDFPRIFPHAEPIPMTDVDAPAIVIVYRNPLPLRRAANAPPYGPNDHDLCVILEVDGAQPDHAILPEVDTTGFHLRLDMPSPDATTEPSLPAEPTIGPSNPVVTPEPAPAWAGDTISVVDCVGAKRDAGLHRGDSGSAASPDDALANVIATARYLDIAIPIEGYAVAATDPAATLFVREDHGRTIAAIAIVAATPGSTTSWVLGSASLCDPAEFDPSVPTGIDPIGTWLDEAGAPVPKSALGAVDDCYGGTQVKLDGRLYVRTPKGGVDPSQLEVSWQPDVAVPATAVDTGYRSGELRLLVAASGGALYVANGGRAERLPHVIGDEVVRTDCN